MKRRLDVALGLVHRPKVLFLDEPTTGLDPEARAAMWEELERLAETERLTILLTTHYLEEADRLARRIAIVSRGRIVVEGEPEELKRGLLGDAVTLELADGNADAAAGVVARLGAVEEAIVDGRHLRARVEEGAQAVPTILSALEADGDLGRGGDGLATVARRRLPPLHGPRLPGRGRGRLPRAMTAAIRDTFSLLVRHQRNFIRQPIWLVFALTQPMFWLLLYSQLFRRIIDLPGFATDSYVQFLTPGWS